MILYFAATGSC